MSDEINSPDSTINRIDKVNYWTWGLGGLLLLSLTAGLLYFYLISVAGSLRNVPSLTVPQIVSGSGILGLVLIFFLYVIHKQRSLIRVRNELIQRQIQEESLRSRLSELSVLFDVSGQVNLQLDQETLLELIARRVLTCLEADRSSIFLIDEGTTDLVCHAVSGVKVEAVREARIAMGEGIAGWVAKNNEPLVLNDDETVAKFTTEIRPGRGISTALCVPMSSGGNVVGILNMSRIEGVRPFTPADARVVTIFAEHAASALIRIRQYAALDHKAGLLHEANQTLAKLNRTKQVFLATVNNELKGPLTIILAYAEFLSQNDAALDITRRQSFASILHEQARRLQGITGQILNISRLEDINVQLDVESTSVNNLIAAAITDLEKTAAGRNVKVRTHLDANAPRIEIDAGLFRQAIHTLLANSIAKAVGGSEIHVTTWADSESVGFEIRGQGIQVTREDMDRVFNLFESTESSSESFLDGLGLGLYLLRRVTELHGGTARARTLDGGGCSFTADLPLDRVRLIPPSEPDQPATSSTTKAA